MCVCVCVRARKVRWTNELLVCRTNGPQRSYLLLDCIAR